MVLLVVVYLIKLALALPDIIYEADEPPTIAPLEPFVPTVSTLLFKSTFPLVKVSVATTCASKLLKVTPAALFMLRLLKGLMMILLPPIVCNVLPTKLTLRLFGV